MTTFYDIPADLLVPGIAARLEGSDSIKQPDWADFVKTGVHKERPPTQDNWWLLRSAAILRKVGRLGPIGVNHLSQEFGGSRTCTNKDFFYPKGQCTSHEVDSRIMH